jgi:hypothetical protein
VAGPGIPLIAAHLAPDHLAKAAGKVSARVEPLKRRSTPKSAANREKAYR